MREQSDTPTPNAEDLRRQADILEAGIEGMSYPAGVLALREAADRIDRLAAENEAHIAGLGAVFWKAHGPLLGFERVANTFTGDIEELPEAFRRAIFHGVNAMLNKLESEGRLRPLRVAVDYSVPDDAPRSLRTLKQEYEESLEAVEEADLNYQETDLQERAVMECARAYIAQLEETLARIKNNADRWGRSTEAIQRGRAGEIINGIIEGIM